MIQTSHKTPSEWSGKFEFKFRTSSRQGGGGWRRSAERARTERETLAVEWIRAGKPRPPTWPCVVTFTRVAPRKLDKGDNLPSAFKAMRDELTARMGLRSDGGWEVEWCYRQLTPAQAGKPTGSYWVVVDIEWRRSGF